MRHIIKGNLQIIYWRGWHFHIGYLKGNPVKSPAAFHLIYKYCLWLGFVEVRKFLTDSERANSLMKYLEKNPIIIR